MKTLPIVWQRLVNTEGRTCPRCHGTGDEMLGALDRLRAALAPLGVEPQLETVELNEAVFLEQPSESNRIWIAGKPLEEWLGGQTGSSRCCNECGDKDCRTVEVGANLRGDSRRTDCAGGCDRCFADVEPKAGSLITRSSRSSVASFSRRQIAAAPLEDRH